MVVLIKSIDKTLTIIELLSKKKSSSLTEIAQETGFNKATAYRLLSTLEHKNYVYQSPQNQRYQLTVKFLYMARHALEHHLIGSVKPVLMALKEATNETVNLMIRMGDYVVFQDKLEPEQASFRTKAYVGMYSDMYCNAGGKALLAFSPQEEQELYWQRQHQAMQPYTENTITDKDAFFLELQNIKQQGYGHDAEENEVGISCVGVSVMDSSLLPAYAISISSLTPRLEAFGIEKMASLIQEEIERYTKNQDIK